MLSRTSTALITLLLLAACGAQEPATAPDAGVDVDKSAPADTASRANSDDSASGAQTTLQSAVDAEHRSADNRARDRYRHPVETLEFFEVEPGMTVVEVWPGGGWYTEILAPYLRNSGTFHAAGFAVSEEGIPDYYKKVHGRFMEKLESRPAVYDNIQMGELGHGDAWTSAPDKSADRVLTFRNVHNWLKGGYAKAMFDSFYRSLKPGGLLGVVEHRAQPGASLEVMKQSGYVTEALVRDLAKNAGFEFVAASEINANSADDRDHPEGVWTLPPRLRGDAARHDEYKAIGESDRMTLKFRRPAE